MRMIYSDAKIIAVDGPPASGKTFLAQKLGQRYDADVLLERAEAFPQRIKQNLLNQRRFLETVLWFRNYQIQRYNEATKLRKSGKWVVLDTFWRTSQRYIACYPLDPFERSVARKLARLDRRLLTSPDVVVQLRTPKTTLTRLLQKRSAERTWEQTPYFLELMCKVREQNDRQLARKLPLNVVPVDRQYTDFARKRDLDKLVCRINDVLEMR